MSSTISRRNILRGAKRLAIAAPFLSIAACDAEDPRGGATWFGGATMGTRYNIRIADAVPGAAARDLRAGIDAILATVDRRMSNWRPDSEVSVFNAGEIASWTAISPDTWTVIDEALRIGHLSNGAFDPTIGPVVDLWGFGPGSAGRRVPAAARIEAAMRRVGLDHIRIRMTVPAVAKDQLGLTLDLSGIAKGFGVDRLARYLDGEGIENYLIDIGGELRGRGDGPRRRPWRIGIEKPVAGRRAVQRIVTLDGGAVATSGDYRNFFESRGARFSHIIDPRTGEPVTHALASVTVIARSTMRADALSTALMVMGPDAGPAFARRENLAALFIVRDGNHFVEFGSPGFDRHLLG